MDGKKPRAVPQKQMADQLQRLERSFERLAADPDRLGTPETALKKLTALQSIIDVVKRAAAEGGTSPAARPPAAPAKPKPPPPPPAEASVTSHDVEVLLSFYEDAVDTIQLARYSVRFGKALSAEPSYPRGTGELAALLRRLIDELRGQAKT